MTTTTTGDQTPTDLERREVTVELDDGRRLAITDQGPVDGVPLVFLHAAPGSRRFDPDPAATAAAGVRFVTFDRAGYGDSSPLPAGSMPSVAGHAEDVVAVLDHLGIAEAALVGWSAGGRIALATAAAHPERVRSVGVVATPAPDDQVPWVQPEHRELSAMLREDPPSAVARLTDIFASGGDPTAAHDGDEGAGDAAETADDDLTAMVTGGGAADAGLVADPTVRARVVAMLALGFEPGPVGVATDIVADQIVPWGFDVAAVGAPVTLVYGEADAVLAPEHGRWYADRLPNATLRVADGGHLVVVTEWAAILAAVLAAFRG